MSRFFRSSDTESDSESSSDNDSLYSQSDSEFDSDAESYHSETEQQQQQPKNRFMKGASDSDDSDDESNVKRKAKSQKDKRIDEMETAVKAIENGQKNNDWNLISTEFDKLTITISRATTGFNAIPLPKFYIKTIVELEEHLMENAQDKSSGKKKAGNTKAMNNLKQKLRKLAKEHEASIAAYKKDPEEFMKEEEEEEVDTTPSTPVKKAAIETIVESDDGFTEIGKGRKRGKEIAPVATENVLLKLREVLENRGKKNTDRNEQTAILASLLKSSNSPFQKISVLLALIASRFDITGTKTTFMDHNAWNASVKEFNQLLEILETNKSFVILEDADDLDNDDKDIVPKDGEIIKMRGSILSFVERLDEEFIKALQLLDPHGTEYIDRLKDEPVVYAALDRSQHYCQVNQINHALPRLVFRKLEHVYYKPEQVIGSLQAASKKLLPAFMVSNDDASQLVNSLCNYLYKDDSTVFRTRAILCNIFHYALHKNYYTARDLLLMSHVQDSIHQADIDTQILYNRAIAQTGICAFRQGLIKESYNALAEIQSSGRVKELLAQGVQTQRPEVEVVERQRQLPFHMHINLELLECIFLTCSMLLEIPAQANKKKFISRPFRRLLDYNERQAFCGPPENTRDHIMSAAKALASGEWEKARDFILAIKIWDLMTETQDIKDMLVGKIQVGGLCTFLFTYCSYYTTLGLSQLSSMFDLPVNTVSAIVAKMIFDEELSASLDQVTQCIILHQVELSKLRNLSLQYSERISQFSNNM